MRILITVLSVTLFSINMFAQKLQPIDSIGLSIPSNYYNLDDSIRQYRIYKLGPIDKSSIVVLGGTIEQNGFRTADGKLYTMRIKVPNSRRPDRMPMPYKWRQRLDSIDRNIIFPPVIKK